MGVTKTIIEEGTGEEVGFGDKVSMRYTGWLKDTSKPENKGDIFDSTENKGRGPFDTKVGMYKVAAAERQVIRGWDEGIPGMKVGEKALLDITSDYAYGIRGYPPVIPPNSTLLFEVQVLQILEKKAPQTQ